MGKAMKAMKKKPISAKLAKRHAFFGKIDKTATGLKKSDLVKSKSGKIVSKKKSALGKQSPWIAAVQKARKELKIKGFAVVKKGTPLYKKAKELMPSECNDQFQGFEEHQLQTWGYLRLSSAGASFL